MKREQNPGLVKGEKAKNLIQHNSSYEELRAKNVKSGLISGSDPQHFAYGFLSVRSGIFRSPDTVVPCLVRRIFVPRRSLSFFGSRNAPTLLRVFRATDRSLTSSSLFPDRGRSVFPIIRRICGFAVLDLAASGSVAPRDPRIRRFRLPLVSCSAPFTRFD